MLKKTTIVRAATLLVACVLVAVTASTLRAQEEPERGWLGVQIRDLTDGDREELEFDREFGVMLGRVVPNAPAAKAGLKEGDVLLWIRETRCQEVASVMEALAGTKPGQRVGFAAWRRGDVFDGRLVLGERPAEFAEGAGREGEARMGQLREQLQEVRDAREAHEVRIQGLMEAIADAGRAGHDDRLRELVGALREHAGEAARLDLRADHLREEMAAVERELEAGEAERGRGRDEGRRGAEEHIEVLRVAMKACLELERKDLAEQIEHKIHAVELTAKGRRDREAIEIIESAPKDGHMAELLHFAAKFYREHEMPDRAEWCEKLGRQYAERHHAARREKEGGPEDRIHRLEGRLAELQKAMEEMRKELERLRRER